MLTLADLLSANMQLLSVGLNPSIPSVKAGYYFANPRNRFWKALNGCGYFKQSLTPSAENCQYLHQYYGIGFTDLVKRPTAGCKDLKAADYRAGPARLQGIVDSLQPKMVWFHGKLTAQKYLQYCQGKKPKPCWGLQAWRINDIPVYISPNPSPANAAYSLQNISDSYHYMFTQLNKVPPC